MSSDFFDRVYDTTAPAALSDLYDDWARTYDADLTASGYRTPARCAAALAAVLPDRTAPIFDFACGTGLSGAALAAEGFATIDGADLSHGMLQVAESRGVYRHLLTANADEDLGIEPGDYAAISAIGALSPGAAPAEYLDRLAGALGPGGLLVFSYNDHTYDDPDYAGRLEALLSSGAVRRLFREMGDHILSLGSKSLVYVLQKT